MIRDLVSEMSVDAGGGYALMAQYLLNDADIDAAFQKMGSEAMAQTMDGCGLVYATFQESRFKRALYGSDVDVFTVWSLEEPPFCLGGTPKLTQACQGRF
jgi:UDP-N-acetyl-D-mannosaminuronic acid transferase (WecB/TagA/CpsF family)